MGKTPLVSVILPVYNGEKYLSESINSILRQSYKNIELIIVDDASTDATNNIIESFKKRDERIKCVRNQNNLKLPKSLNVGFSYAKGDYLTWTSDDNIYEKDAIEIMVKHLKLNKLAPMVVADMNTIDDNGNLCGKWDEFSYMGLACSNTVGACFLYRSEIASSIGAYNENLFLVEDYDYWLRIAFKFGRIDHIKKALYKYRIHQHSLSNAKKKGVRENLCKLRLMYLEKLIDLVQNDDSQMVRLYCELSGATQLNQMQKAMFISFCDVLKYEKMYEDGKPTIIYGAGRYGDVLSKIIRNVVFFVDSDKKKVGGKLNEIEIIGRERLTEIMKENQLIVAVNSQIVFSVLDDLLKEGVKSWCLMQSVLFQKGYVYDQIIELL